MIDGERPLSLSLQIHSYNFDGDGPKVYRSVTLPGGSAREALTVPASLRASDSLYARAYCHYWMRGAGASFHSLPTELTIRDS